jgi:Zn-finger nucleic acid-binding protein
MSRLTVREDETTPLCPHCELELRSVSLRRIESDFGVRYLYFCPHCRKVLGVSHRKGFWMG